MNVHTYCKYFIYGITIFIFMSHASCSIAETTMISRSSATYKEVLPLAIAWKDAVLNKRYDVLVSYALPEAQERVRNKFNDSQSGLYKIFYDTSWNNQRGRKSIWKIFTTADQLAIVIEQVDSLLNYGNGLRIYFYDDKKIVPKFPLDDMTLQKMIEKGDVVMVFFFKTEGRWYTSYSF